MTHIDSQTKLNGNQHGLDSDGVWLFHMYIEHAVWIVYANGVRDHQQASRSQGVGRGVPQNGPPMAPKHKDDRVSYRPKGNVSLLTVTFDREEGVPFKLLIFGVSCLILQLLAPLYRTHPVETRS